ncbi:MAG TPA: hypothetical protein VGZ47_02360 [Gemmataceae bacterium]|jgi:hypothetical protein|nr:hypothetical protein [Gemmataceae bacterium]
MIRIFGSAVAVAAALGGASFVDALPVQSGTNNTITDRKNFIPTRKFEPLAGKAIGLLVSDVQPVLNAEGRTGPENQLCFAQNGCSYRWAYVPAENNPRKTNLDLPVSEKGERKHFENVCLATAETVKPFGIQAKYALVELEVNGGLGCPACHSFAATKITRLDGTKEFPLDVAKVIAELSKKYDEHLRDEAQKIDNAMVEAGEKYLKDEKATGPRERSELMFLTWLPDSQRLRAHFRTRMTDGAYKYAAGLNIELGPNMPKADQPGEMPSTRLPNGLRYGKQFGIDFGMAYEVSKTGEIEKSLILPIESFQKDLPMPKVFEEKKK